LCSNNGCTRGGEIVSSLCGKKGPVSVFHRLGLFYFEQEGEAPCDYLRVGAGGSIGLLLRVEINARKYA
jgi:hypothetical protein